MPEKSYLVTAIGGLYAVGRQDAAWHRYQWEAENDIRQRLDVQKLHLKARSLGLVYGDGEVIRHPDGTEWQRTGYYEFSVVPASHPDYRRSAKFKLSFMERVVR